MKQKDAQSGFQTIADQVAPLSGPTLRAYVENRLGIERRQAQASVSSWSVEGWMKRAADGKAAALPNSVDYRCAVQIDRRDESRQVNGKRGGRPRK